MFIPLGLQDGLKERLEEVLKDLTYDTPLENGKTILRKVQVFTQNLPVKKKSDDNPFPFVLIKLVDGTQSNRVSDHSVKTFFIAGIYDDNLENNGHREAVNLINKIIQTLTERPVIANKYEVDFDSPISWSLPEEETTPYYYASTAVFFDAQKITRLEREDLERFM